MADRCNFFFRQLVQENELDLAFEQLEAADQNLITDVGIFGIISGAEPIPHDPIPDLTITLTAPGKSYDRLGQRVYFGTDQSIDCSVDYTGIPTSVSQAGNERWLGVFLKFDRLLSDPRTDGNSQQIYFRHDEHFQILVRQASEAPSGSAQRVPLVDDEILVCDILLVAGQTQIIADDIILTRRQAFIFSRGSSIEITPVGWRHIDPVVNTVQGALDSVDTVFDEHFKGANQHAAEDITFTPYSYVDGDNVQTAIAAMVNSLATLSSTNPGASRIGSRAQLGDPKVIPSGSVDSQIAVLLGYLNAHLNDDSSIHPAAGITVEDTQGRLSSNYVEGALQEILEGFEADHYRQNQTNRGQHRAIRQPDLGSGRVLLFHSRGNGSDFSQLRIFADDAEVWFTVNADWNGSQWVKDALGTSGGIRLERANIRFINHYSTSSLNFDNWPNSWLLPMTSAISNSSFEVYGDVRETGRIGFRGTNTHSSGTTMCLGGTVTFRNRFPSTPVSITVSALETNDWSATPIITQVDRDGFSYYSYAVVNSNVTGWWYGKYSATT